MGDTVTYDGTTYGPSQDIYTRTPVNYGPTNSDLGPVAGLFTPPTSVISQIVAKLAGSYAPGIRVDPERTGNPNRTLRHEATHALFNNLDLGSIQANLPSFSKILAAFPQQGYGNPTDEIPAYAAAGELSDIRNHPISQDWRDEYINQLTNALVKMNPAIAQKFQKITRDTKNAGDSK